MDRTPAPDRTDAQLEVILAEVSNWVVNGPRGQVLCQATSLRGAMDRARDYAKADAVVVALTRLPPDRITVLPAQAERLRKFVAERESLPLAS